MNYTGNGWDEILSGEFNAPYFKALMEKVNAEYATGTVYPPKDEIFAAMKTVDYDKVKAVIIGQDPYHGAGQANGMAFSVNKGVPLPPSLQNIFKEIQNEYGASPDGGTLIGWAKQGVLLLNTVLTVREASPQSHSAYGWQQFTDAVIEACNKRSKPMVFLLWGSNAIAKKKFISAPHLVLESAHPSPLSAYRGFFGCGHFRKANQVLVANGQHPIDWLKADDDDDSYYGSGTITRI